MRDGKATFVWDDSGILFNDTQQAVNVEGSGMTVKVEKTETFIEHDIIIGGIKAGTVELCPERKEISRLVIFEPYQNKGYGTQVVKELVAQGYKYLWVRADNERAIHVYEKCGFKKGEPKCFEMIFEEESEK